MEIHAIVTPGARKEKVVRTEEGKFTIAVREPAERNEANARVREILADAFRVPMSKVRMLRGVRSRKKVYKVTA